MSMNVFPDIINYYCTVISDSNKHPYDNVEENLKIIGIKSLPLFCIVYLPSKRSNPPADVARFLLPLSSSLSDCLLVNGAALFKVILCVEVALLCPQNEPIIESMGSNIRGVDEPKANTELLSFFLLASILASLSSFLFKIDSNRFRSASTIAFFLSSTCCRLESSFSRSSSRR